MRHSGPDLGARALDLDPQHRCGGDLGLGRRRARILPSRRHEVVRDQSHGVGDFVGTGHERGVSEQDRGSVVAGVIEGR